MTIRGIGLTAYGGPEALHEVDLTEPRADQGQVRVRVRAAGVNPVDAMLRTGLLAGGYAGLEPPFVPGMEIAGRLDEIGAGVDPSAGLSVGMDVVGFVDFHGSHGGYSDVVALPAASVTRKPARITDAEAASFLNNALTARNTLDALTLPAGSTLLVTGAAGGVGYLTELGATAGLRVIAVADRADEVLVRSLGAAMLVPRGADLAWRVRDLLPSGVDAAADAAKLGPQILSAVRDGGQIGALRGWEAPPCRDITVHRLNVRDRATDVTAIADLTDLVDGGKLTTRVAEVIPATEASRAHRLLDRGGLRGRLVLDFTA